MAFNLFRVTVLAVLGAVAYFAYNFMGGPAQLTRSRRAPTAGQGICSFYESAAYGNVPAALIYGTKYSHADAISQCAALPGGYKLGSLDAGSVTTAMGPTYGGAIQAVGAFCPAAADVVNNDPIVWIGDWNGDNYNGACIAVTVGANGNFAVTTRDCNEKHAVWCTAPYQQNDILNAFAGCQRCSPTPGGPTCDITTSCTKVGPNNFCACRSGYNAAGNQGWRMPTQEKAAGADPNRVFVPPGVACNTLCNNWALSNRCEEVRAVDICAESCFPGSAILDVATATGETIPVPMKDVKTGMKIQVAVGNGRELQWSEVAFRVSLKGRPAFVDVDYVATNGETGRITLTATHLIAVVEGGVTGLVRAADVKIGQKVYHQKHALVEVTSTETRLLPADAGAYTVIPNTASALLFVDSIMVSPYANDMEHHERADRIFGTAARMLYRTLKVMGREHWMEAPILQRLPERLKPYFVDVEKVENVMFMGGAAVAAALGVACVKKGMRM